MASKHTHTYTGKDAENLEAWYIAEGNVKWHSHSRNGLVIPQKAKRNHFMTREFHS